MDDFVLGRQVLPELDAPPTAKGAPRLVNPNITKDDYIGQRANTDTNYHCVGCKGWQQRAQYTYLKITEADGREYIACACNCHVGKPSAIAAQT